MIDISKNKKIRDGEAKGFTLIEILIVVTLFAIVIVPVMGFFSYTVNTQKYGLATEQLLDQASYAMDYMYKLTRMAKKSSASFGMECGADVPDGKNYSAGGSELRFIRNRGGARVCQIFGLSAGKVYSAISPDSYILTSNNIEITRLTFNVIGDTTNSQPRVSIILEAQVRNMNPAPKVRLETTVSLRDLNTP